MEAAIHYLQSDPVHCERESNPSPSEHGHKDGADGEKEEIKFILNKKEEEGTVDFLDSLREMDEVVSSRQLYNH
jgi:hypothetical protein